MRFLSSLIVVFSLAEATLPACALSIPALTLDVRSTDAAGALILVKKGKGHGDRDERFERHHRHHAHGTSRHRAGFGCRRQNPSNGRDLDSHRTRARHGNADDDERTRGRRVDGDARSAPPCHRAPCLF